MEQITIVSTHVRDVMLDESSNVLGIRKGGPAYFLEYVFKEEHCPYALITGDELEVEIVLVVGKGEIGRMKNPLAPKPIPAISTPNLLVSTAGREWDMTTLAGYSGKIFLDAQGFVRSHSSDFGQKKLWKEIADINPRPFCLKGTLQEIGYIPDDFVDEQKQRRCLVVTKGSEGSEIFHRGAKFSFVPSIVCSPPDTIGAGDTYFAHFVIAFLRTGNFEEAGEIATMETLRFLQRKGGHNGH